MDKPKAKCEIAIRAHHKPFIYIDASPDAIEDLQEFGVISLSGGMIGFMLCVDSRYDFDEILTYIENYGEETDDSV